LWGLISDGLLGIGIPQPIPVLLRWTACWVCFSATILICVFELSDFCERLPVKTKVLGCSLLIGIFPVVFCNLVYSQWRSEQGSKLEGDLLGGQEFASSDYPGITPASIEIGNSGTILFVTSGEWQWFQDAGVRIEQGKRGPVVTTPIRDRLGNLVVSIERNHWTCYPPYCLDRNWTDDSLEVRDSAGHIALQLKLITSGMMGVSGMQGVQIQGEWRNVQGQGRRLVTASDHVGGGGYIAVLTQTNQVQNELIRPMFRYPAKKYWGVLADGNRVPSSWHFLRQILF
jgi:hypothetical protein